jgi:hypothetical protein
VKPLIVMVIAGRLPEPSASTISSGIRMPVAVLSLWKMVVRNRMLEASTARG